MAWLNEWGKKLQSDRDAHADADLFQLLGDEGRVKMKKNYLLDQDM